MVSRNGLKRGEWRTLKKGVVHVCFWGKRDNGVSTAKHACEAANYCWRMHFSYKTWCVGIIFFLVPDSLILIFLTVEEHAISQACT